MVSLYGEVRFIDMYAMAYITRIKKTFLPDARRSSNFIKRMEKLTNKKGKYLSDAKKKVLTLNVSKQLLAKRQNSIGILSHIGLPDW